LLDADSRRRLRKAGMLACSNAPERSRTSTSLKSSQGPQPCCSGSSEILLGSIKPSQVRSVRSLSLKLGPRMGPRASAPMTTSGRRRSALRHTTVSPPRSLELWLNICPAPLCLAARDTYRAIEPLSARNRVLGRPVSTPPWCRCRRWSPTRPRRVAEECRDRRDAMHVRIGEGRPVGGGAGLVSLRGAVQRCLSALADAGSVIRSSVNAKEGPP
jgi:hypothetical protein